MKEKPIATEQGQKLAKEVCMFVVCARVKQYIYGEREFTFPDVEVSHQVQLDSCVLI